MPTHDKSGREWTLAELKLAANNILAMVRDPTSTDAVVFARLWLDSLAPSAARSTFEEWWKSDGFRLATREKSFEIWNAGETHGYVRARGDHAAMAQAVQEIAPRSSARPIKEAKQLAEKVRDTAEKLADKIQDCADIPDGVPWSQDELDLIETALRAYSPTPSATQRTYACRSCGAEVVWPHSSAGPAK